jgi:predicted ATP-dependent endonuclease of OLD family
MVNLGMFEQVIHKHEKENSISISLDIFDNEKITTYGISLNPNSSHFQIEVKNELKDKLEISFPYQLNINKPISLKNKELNILWNGLTVQNAPKQPQNAQNIDDSFQLIKDLNSVINFVKQIDIVPLKRGFFKPLYTQVSVTPNLLNEDEIATSLMNDYGYIQGEISHYCETIFNKSFKTHTPLNSTSFYLRIADKARNGLETEIIHEGFGLNQVVFTLAKILNQNNKFIFIEEPETHLHPSAQSKLIDTYIDIIKNKDKQICISTHSEIMVSTILTKISEGKISANDVQCYFVENEKDTMFEKQKINENGTIEGGLMSFMETELDNFKTFLGINGK